MDHIDKQFIYANKNLKHSYSLFIQTYFLQNELTDENCLILIDDLLELNLSFFPNNENSYSRELIWFKLLYLSYRYSEHSSLLKIMNYIENQLHEYLESLLSSSSIYNNDSFYIVMTSGCLKNNKSSVNFERKKIKYIVEFFKQQEINSIKTLDKLESYLSFDKAIFRLLIEPENLDNFNESHHDFYVNLLYKEEGLLRFSEKNILIYDLLGLYTAKSVGENLFLHFIRYPELHVHITKKLSFFYCYSQVLEKEHLHIFFKMITQQHIDVLAQSSQEYGYEKFINTLFSVSNGEESFNFIKSLIEKNFNWDKLFSFDECTTLSSYLNKLTIPMRNKELSANYQELITYLNAQSLERNLDKKQLDSSKNKL